MQNEILYRFLKCETSPEEEKAIADWLDADQENRRILDALQFTMEGISLLSSEIEADTVKIVRTNPSLIARIGRWAGAAAAVLALAVVGSVYLTNRKLEKWAGLQMVSHVPAGQRMSITLPDGTSVWLNSDSKITYPTHFSHKHRRVAVEGEALFDVAHDSNRPFIVETFACDVEVLGTSFDVTAQKEKDVFSTAVFSGRVKVTNRLTQGEEYMLNPNEQVRLEGVRLIHGTFPDRDEYLWTGGIISVRGLTFEQLMRKFEKDFGVKISIECSRIPVIGFNYGKIRIADGIDSALRLLQLESDFSYSRDENDGSITIRD